MKKTTGPGSRVERISLSVPQELLRQFDEHWIARGFGNRSQAVTAVLQTELLTAQRENPEALMAGSITLFFRQDRSGLLELLAKLKRRFIDEVIGTLQVQLADSHLMEVLLVQGPVKKLHAFTDALVACKGVKAGSLTLTSELIPPLHPLPEKIRYAKTNRTKK